MEFLFEVAIAVVVGIGQQVFVNFLFRPFAWFYSLFDMPTEESFGFEEEELTQQPEPVLATISEDGYISATWQKPEKPKTVLLR